ncbi:MAG TPA: OPT family oligopeptide transporter, partial [Gemmataceae bacterium]|nr:OPT family oligopeptide transporter [Gemmataceae bacterium]
MAHDPTVTPDPSSALDRPKPPGLRELSPRAILCGLAVAALMGASYPYVVLKLGFGPNVSVVAAILGYIILGLLLAKLLPMLGARDRPFNRWENNLVQAAGTAAAQTAFLCVLLAAFDMLTQSKVVRFDYTLTPVQAFAWLTTAGLLGVLLAAPLRRHYVVDEKLPYPDGVAAGETLRVLDSGGQAAQRAAYTMLIGVVASALLTTLTSPRVFDLFDSTLLFGTGVLATTGVGVEWSLLAIGSGMLISLRINLSMLLGTLLSWVVAAYALREAGVLGEKFTRTDVLFWVMWPATGMLVAGGLTALALRWRVLMRAFRSLTASSAGGADEFPLRWVVVGSLLCAAALVIVQHELLGQPVWITLVAIVLSIPLALVGLRVLGETNWGPISALSNMMQGFFAFLAPGNVSANMVASGTTGTVASSSEGNMQSYKTGHMIGSSPRCLTIMQLLAIPVGAAAVAWMYPVLRAEYGIGGETGLSSPISRKWAGFAEVLSKGIDALPPGALAALVIGSLLGVVLAVLEMKVKRKEFVPSPTGLGIGMLVPASVIVMMVVGGIVAAIWMRRSPRTSGPYLTPLASGLIAGEALVAVAVPLLIVSGILK